MASAALLVVPGVAGLVGGVPPADLALFTAWIAAFVILPGLVVHRAVFARRNWLESLAVGVPVGYAGQLLVYLAGAAAGLRELAWVWPAIGVVGLGIIVCRLDSGPPNEPAPPRSAVLTASVVTVVGAALLLLQAYLNTPIPLPVGGATYYADLVYHHSIAAEALHHWPIQSPWAVGTEFNYHWFFHVYAASISDVTGIDLVWVVHRLYLPPMLALIGVQLTFLGWHVTKRRSVAVLTPALFFLAGEFDLLADAAVPFLGTTLTNLWLSPTYTYGMILFLASIAVIGRILRDRRTSRGIYVALAVLLAAGTGAKGSVLPTLIGGLSLVGSWRLVRNRHVDPVVFRLGLISVLVFALVYVFVFAGAAAGGHLELDPLRTLTRFPLAQAGPAGARFFVGGASLFLLLVPLAGFLALNGLRATVPRPWLAWLGALTLVAVTAFVVFDHSGTSQLYLLHYGYTAGLVVSAAGLRHMSLLVAPDRRCRSVAVLVAGCVITVIAVVLIIERPGEPMTSAKLVATYASAAVVMGLTAALGRARLRTPVSSRWSAAAFATLLIVSLTVIDSPLDIAGTSRVGGTQAAHRGSIDQDFVQAMRWLRAHSDADEVLAVDNHFRETRSSRFYAYSAYAERRVFLESWDYSAERSTVPEGGQPFPERLALNQSVFIDHDREALQRMVSHWGVRYLVHDRSRGYASDGWRSLGTVVFENEAATVIKVG